MKLASLRQKLKEQQIPPTNPSNINRQTLANISLLVRKGLMPSRDLPALKVALARHSQMGDIAKLSKNHRDVIQRYNSALSTAALGSMSSVMALGRNIKEDFDSYYDVFQKDHIFEDLSADPPVLIVLKRKGIRIFPDGKRVALYVNEKLGLTFTVPYSTNKGAENPMVGVTEELEEIIENIDQVFTYAQQENPKQTAKHMKFDDGSKLKVSHGAAKAIHMVHGALNPENQKKFAEMLTNPKGFEKAAHFALNKVNFSIGDK